MKRLRTDNENLSKTRRFRNWLLSEVTPYLGAREAERIIRSQDHQDPTDGRAVTIDLDRLQALLASEFNRKRVVEDKARANVTAIGLAMTVFSLLTPLSGTVRFQFGSCWLAYVLSGLGVLTFLWFLSGGLSALRALRVEALWDIYLEDEADLVDKPETTRKQKLVECIENNQKITLIRSNYVDASYCAIRNAILCMAVTGIVTVIRLLCDK